MPISSHSLFLHPKPWEPLFFLSEWICLFWTLHINGIIHMWSFVSGLFHLACLQGSSTIQHAPVLSSLLMAENRSFVRSNHILFIHPPVDGHLGCFHFSPITEMLKWTFMYKFSCRHVFIPLGYILSSKTAESHGNSMLNFLRNCQSFPKQLQHFKFTPATYEGSNYILTNTCYCLFYYSHPSRCKVISTVFLICLPLMTNDAEHFFIYFIYCLL